MINKNVSYLLQLYGYPDKVEKAPENNNKLYVYEYGYEGENKYTVYKGTLYKNGTNHHYCTYYFEVNSRNIVVLYSYRGRNCFE